MRLLVSAAVVGISISGGALAATSVFADVTDSNVYDPDGSWWKLTAAPLAGGSRVEMIWQRNFNRTLLGRLLNIVFKRAGNRLFDRYAQEILRNLEELEAQPELG